MICKEGVILRFGLIEGSDPRGACGEADSLSGPDAEVAGVDFHECDLAEGERGATPYTADVARVSPAYRDCIFDSIWR